MLQPIYLDSVFDAVLESEASPSAQDFLKAIVEDPKVIAAVQAAVESLEKTDGPPKPGPSPAQEVRQALLEVLSS
ncbi:MAG: hypothetical protein AAFU85_02170 [Planctomycetota bacterium]